MGTGTQTFDVCVIGSGPAGGILAKELAESGAKVVLVEAGRAITLEEFHTASSENSDPLNSRNSEPSGKGRKG